MFLVVVVGVVEAAACAVVQPVDSEFLEPALGDLHSFVIEILLLWEV